MIEIEINGQKLQAEPGTMIIQAADLAGLYIPRFCYHKKLPIAASCRMCLIEIEGSRKPMPACATPVAAGMKILTQSKMAVEAQRSVMEFLLINHPLDCPICDQGGECELQDLSMGYGGDHSQYNEGKRSVHDQYIGPLIKTDMTRCILCSRCIRFGTEIAGYRELGVVGRGEHAEVTTYLTHSMESELSGNIIDLCPVGALTNKPYRYTARAWELSQHMAVAPHDCVGSHLFIHTQNGKVKRAVAKECESINETWISDRDRYSCFAVSHPDRAAHPQIKTNGVWQTVSWDVALMTATQRLQKIIETLGAEQVGGLLSPSSTVEEAYLFQKWLRGLDCQNIDYRLRQQDFADDASFLPASPTTLDHLSACKTIIIVGSYVRKDQPIINHRLRQAALKGAHLYCINPVAFESNFKWTGELIQIDLVHELAILAHYVAEKMQQALPAFLKTSAKITNGITDLHREIAARLIEQGAQTTLCLGSLALHHPQASLIRAIAKWIIEKTNSSEMHFTEGANSPGAWFAGALPQNTASLNALEMVQKPRAAYVLLGVEPEFDHAHSGLALQALQQASCVIALTAYTNPRLYEYADVILPIGAFTETAGTFVNMEGKWQSFTGAAQPYTESRPAWKVLRVLGNLSHISGFNYVTANDVLAEAQLINRESKNKNETTHKPLQEHQLFESDTLIRIATTPIYSIDTLVRHALPLQDTPDAHQAATISIHPALAKKLGIQEGEKITARQDMAEVCLPVTFHSGLPQNAVLLPASIESTIGMGLNFAPITLRGA